MKAYRVSAPDGRPNLRIRRVADKKPSADARREREAPGYLEKIRKLPCCNEPPPSHAHHLKCTGEGIGKKSSNKWAVPLCYECHTNGVERIGSRQEAAWFWERGILCLDLAAALYANSHSLDAMMNVLKTHRGNAAEAISAAARTCKGPSHAGSGRRCPSCGSTKLTKLGEDGSMSAHSSSVRSLG